MFQQDYYHTVLQECRVLLHPKIRESENIISLFGLDFHEDYDEYKVAWPIMIMEYAEYATLDTFQEDFDTSSALERALLLDVARGIDSLHQYNIIHGDVKSENIVVCRHDTRDYIAKLSDFGLSIINPDPNVDTHRLLGGTALWMAPEYEQPLSVGGLKKTDVYSFGLTVWRVLTKNPIPYSLLPMQFDQQHASLMPASLDEIVMHARNNADLPSTILRTIRKLGIQQAYVEGLIRATADVDPADRDLALAISVLTDGQQQSLGSLEESPEYWELEEPTHIFKQLAQRFPSDLVPFALKPSVLHSFQKSLWTVFDGPSEELGRYAGWLAFQCGASPVFPVLSHSVEESCNTLERLCKIDSLLASSVTAAYHRIHGRQDDGVDLDVTETAASKGSIFALHYLQGFHLDRYDDLLSSPLDFETIHSEEQSTSSEDYEEGEVFANAQDSLVQSCRKGNFEGVMSALADGCSAVPESEGLPSALHWLISFHDEQQIEELVPLLFAHGAVLDAWEGGEAADEDYVSGRVFGTPLHWAVWHRNVPLVKSLLNADPDPAQSHIDRALALAALMHFDDVLEIFRRQAQAAQFQDVSEYDWHSALTLASNSIHWLPRVLQHGINGQRRALERTLDIITSMIEPSEEDVIAMLNMSLLLSSPTLMKYLFTKLRMNKDHKALAPLHVVQMCLAIGNEEIFELFLEHGVITPQSRFGAVEFTPLQMVLFTHQRNPYFIRRFLDLGCPVDESGGTPTSHWSAFYITVFLGMYELAVILLEHGADKGFLSNWAGGYTITMAILGTWRDVPISRLRFLLEDIPRLGFGHISFWAWPGLKGNVLYGVCLNPWGPYTAGYRLSETTKYILSNIADKRCLNELYLTGNSALRMAATAGSQEVMQELIAAGIDVNAGVGFTPLQAANEWLAKCKKRLKAANKNRSGSERRLAAMLVDRAQMCVDLLLEHGGFERGFVGSMLHVSGNVLGGMNLFDISFETFFEMVAYYVQENGTRAGTLALNPSSKQEFRFFHGQKTALQKIFGYIGRRADSIKGAQKDRGVLPRWHQHSCWPWRGDNCRPSCIGAPFIDPYAVRQGLPNNTFPTSLPTRISNSSLVSRRQAYPPSNPSLAHQPQSSGPSNQFYMNLPADSTRAEAPSLPPRPMSPQIAIQNIRNALLTFFLESPDVGNLSSTQRHQEAIRLLGRVLQAPILLVRATDDPFISSEFTQVKTAVEDTLEALELYGME